MAEAADKESKTEEPTERRVRDAVEKGNVPVSREASIFASLAGILIVAAFLLTGPVARLSFSLEQLIDEPGGWALDDGSDASRLFGAIGGEASRFLLPLIVTLALAGLVASFLQNAPQFALERIRPDASRISIHKNWQRIFGTQGRTEFFKAAFKFVIVSIVAVVLLKSEEHRVVNAMFVEPTAVPELILAIAMRLLAAVSVATIVLVAADLVWVRVHWRRDLRMSRQELKDEHKEVEGDPFVKARLRSLGRDRARRRMIAAVPKATLVIANPTHFAIALRYVREEGGAPMVVAKGQDLVALKIREIAEEHAIPIVEDKALARSMYDSVEIDRMIPAEFYRAVAEIIYFLQSGGNRRTLAR
jgi:flagellar biosynthetic protein FlhB